MLNRILVEFPYEASANVLRAWAHRAIWTLQHLASLSIACNIQRRHARWCIQCTQKMASILHIQSGQSQNRTLCKEALWGVAGHSCKVLQGPNHIRCSYRLKVNYHSLRPSYVDSGSKTLLMWENVTDINKTNVFLKTYSLCKTSNQ